jgi:hypothetical protein
MIGFVFGLVAAALLQTLGLLPDGRVVEARSLSAYQGRWSSVQAMGFTFELKGNRFTHVAADRKEFQQSVGSLQMKDIAPQSAAWRADMNRPADPRTNPESQAFYGQCSVNGPNGPNFMVPTGQFIPCAMILYDSSSKYPPVRKRILIGRVGGPNFVPYNFVNGYFDPIKPR